MFSFKPNPDYTPGGISNFWISGSSTNGGPPNRTVGRPQAASGGGKTSGAGNEGRKSGGAELQIGKFGSFIGNVSLKSFLEM